MNDDKDWKLEYERMRSSYYTVVAKLAKQAKEFAEMQRLFDKAMDEWAKDRK